jgi:hypothetical protein
MVTGFVIMMFQAQFAIRRIMLGLICTVTYMATLLTFRPYVRRDLNFLAAIGAQYLIAWCMGVALSIRIFSDIETLVDRESAQRLMNYNGPSDVRT